jgi:ADP-ribose pyrophosphatase
MYFTSPGFLDEQMHLFLAEDLEEGEQDLDDDEDVEIVRWPVEEVEWRLDELEDLKTLAALLLYLRSR